MKETAGKYLLVTQQMLKETELMIWVDKFTLVLSSSGTNWNGCLSKIVEFGVILRATASPLPRQRINGVLKIYIGICCDSEEPKGREVRMKVGQRIKVTAN